MFAILTFGELSECQGVQRDEKDDQTVGASCAAEDNQDD